MLSGSGLGKEGVKGVVSATDSLVRGHLTCDSMIKHTRTVLGRGQFLKHTIGLDAMLQAVKLPASVSNLAASLANVYRDTFTLQKELLDVTS